MTTEEAIRILGRMLDEFCNEDSYAPECKDAVDMAIEALKKQIPEKPSEDQAHIMYFCPNCHSYDYTLPYCRYCGQHLSFKEV